MMELGPFACRDCGSPLRFSALRWPAMLSCVNALPGEFDCRNRDPFKPRGPRERTVDKFECSGGCGWTVKVRDGQKRPESRYCGCGGMLVFVARQTR